MDNQTPKPPRTAAATAARMRNREETAAELLRSRGWDVRSPEDLLETKVAESDIVEVAP